MFKELLNMNFKSMTVETMATKIIDWALESGVKLVVGILLMVIGFKFINKLSKKFVKFAERRNLDLSLL